MQDALHQVPLTLLRHNFFIKFLLGYKKKEGGTKWYSNPLQKFYSIVSQVLL